MCASHAAGLAWLVARTCQATPTGLTTLGCGGWRWIRPAVATWMAMHRCAVRPSYSRAIRRAAAFTGQQQQHLPLFFQPDTVAIFCEQLLTMSLCSHCLTGFVGCCAGLALLVSSSSAGCDAGCSCLDGIDGWWFVTTVVMPAFLEVETVCEVEIKTGCLQLLPCTIVVKPRSSCKQPVLTLAELQAASLDLGRAASSQSLTSSCKTFFLLQPQLSPSNCVGAVCLFWCYVLATSLLNFCISQTKNKKKCKIYMRPKHNKPTSDDVSLPQAAWSLQPYRSAAGGPLLSSTDGWLSSASGPGKAAALMKDVRRLKQVRTPFVHYVSLYQA